jgi:hypothetical protein
VLILRENTLKARPFQTALKAQNLVGIQQSCHFPPNCVSTRKVAQNCGLPRARKPVFRFKKAAKQHKAVVLLQVGVLVL